jgi:hypothetical protein
MFVFGASSSDNPAPVSVWGSGEQSLSPFLSFLFLSCPDLHSAISHCQVEEEEEGGGGGERCWKGSSARERMFLLSVQISSASNNVKAMVCSSVCLMAIFLSLVFEVHPLYMSLSLLVCLPAAQTISTRPC